MWQRKVRMIERKWNTKRVRECWDCVSFASDKSREKERCFGMCVYLFISHCCRCRQLIYSTTAIVPYHIKHIVSITIPSLVSSFRCHNLSIPLSFHICCENHFFSLYKTFIQNREHSKQQREKKEHTSSNSKKYGGMRGNDYFVVGPFEGWGEF